MVLKVIKDMGWSDDPGFNWYWKRGALAYESGLLDNLPGPLRAARGYGVQEFEGEAWIWMEQVVDRMDGHWSLEQHAFAAQQLGQFNAAFLNGTPQPDYPWLNKSQSQDWVNYWSPDKFLDQPCLLEVFPEPNLKRLRQLCAERERFLAILDTLPAAFTHHDFKRRNLFLLQRADGSDELVAIDWAECGVVALGRDLAYVIGTNYLFNEYAPAAIEELDAAAFEAYLSGLRQAGWQGDVNAVRLGYTAWLALKFGSSMPRMLAGALATEESRRNAARSNHMPVEELISTWSHFGDFILGRYDEARRLAEPLL